MAVAFAGVLVLAYILIRRLLDAVFTREEQQNKLVKRFTGEISQSLSTADIMDKLSTVISSEIPTGADLRLPSGGGCLPGQILLQSSGHAVLLFFQGQSSDRLPQGAGELSHFAGVPQQPPLPLFVGDGKGAFPPG